jgi:hypothetical protein
MLCSPFRTIPATKGEAATGDTPWIAGLACPKGGARIQGGPTMRLLAIVSALLVMAFASTPVRAQRPPRSLDAL